MELEFKLTREEIDLILGLLGKAPWEVSATLISKIRSQALEQIKARSEKAQSEKTEPELESKKKPKVRK